MIVQAICLKEPDNSEFIEGENYKIHIEKNIVKVYNGADDLYHEYESIEEFLEDWRLI